MTSENIIELIPEQVKAARALLAWSQQELATAANVSISTVADFERGARTPVANNAQAMAWSQANSKPHFEQVYVQGRLFG